MNRTELVETIRQRLHRLPDPYASHYGVLPPAPSQSGVALGPVAATIARANQALAEAAGMQGDPKDGFAFSRVLVRKEAVSSSSIEGTHSTLDELLEVEEGDSDQVGNQDAYQVRDYAIALEEELPRAWERGNDVFSLELVKRLHAAAMRSNRDYPDVPGKFRERVVWIGGTGAIATSTYNPPAPVHVEGCLKEQISYLNGDGMHVMTQDLVTRMAIAHAHFESVHPFRDGNGRVGRLLLPLMMAAEGKVPLYLSPYIEENKSEYYAGLKAAQQKLDYVGLTGFLAEAMTATVEEVKRSRNELSSLRESWLGRRSFRKGSAAIAAIQLLPDYPVVTIRRLEQLLGVSYQAASNAVRDLEQVGILKEKTGYQRNRMFVAKEVLAILNRPLSKEPEYDQENVSGLTS